MNRLLFRQLLKEKYKKTYKSAFHYWGYINGGFVNPLYKNHILSDSEQWTGLFDSKRTKKYPEGQMIFEGDILQDARGAFISTYAIEYREDLASFTHGGWDMPSQEMIKRWGSVIGNIHQHGDLLK